MIDQHLQKGSCTEIEIESLVTLDALLVFFKLISFLFDVKCSCKLFKFSFRILGVVLFLITLNVDHILQIKSPVDFSGWSSLGFRG